MTNQPSSYSDEFLENSRRERIYFTSNTDLMKKLIKAIKKLETTLKNDSELKHCLGITDVLVPGKYTIKIIPNTYAFTELSILADLHKLIAGISSFVIICKQDPRNLTYIVQDYSTQDLTSKGIYLKKCTSHNQRLIDRGYGLSLYENRGAIDRKNWAQLFTETKHPIRLLLDPPCFWYPFDQAALTSSTLTIGGRLPWLNNLMKEIIENPEIWIDKETMDPYREAGDES
jgi:hypothetical protein